jgi:hypothetical protein
MKRFSVLLFVFVMFVSFTACSNNNSKSFIGEWTKVSGSTGFVGMTITEIKGGEVTVFLLEEQKGFWCGSGRVCTIACKYDKENNKIFGSMFASFTIYMEGKNLMMNFGRGVLTFVKK